jgi:Pyruvate/2-oxoacid:ferredoxin oxidoreductase delta subunit
LPQITCDKCDLQIPEKLFARHIKRVHENQDENEEFHERFGNDVKVEVTLEEQDENLTEAQLDSFEADLDNFQCGECGKYCKDQKHLDHHKQVSSVMEFLFLSGF